MYYRKRGMSWANSTPKSNRDDLRALAGKRISPGLIAYHDGQAVGWVSLGPREAYDRLESSKMLGRVDDTPVWSIVCFVVSAKSRRQGIATRLLQAAIEYAREHGATTLEAYPIAASRGRVSGSAAYNGTQSMFEKQGFKIVAERRWDASSPARPIMRLALT